MMSGALQNFVKEPGKFLLAAKGGDASGLLYSAAIIGGINLFGFTLTATTKSHKFTDLFGTGAFVCSAAASAYVNGVHLHPYSRPALLSLAVSIWGTRLACHLFERILTSPSDPRLAQFLPKKGEKWFDSSKSNFPLNLAGFWMIQAAWAWVVSIPVTLTNFNFGKLKSTEMMKLGMGGKIALLAFSCGFLFESVADWQKRKFKKNPANRNRWIDEGLWSLSRHPNYFGEMLVWWSVFFSAVPALTSPKQLVLGISSPIFISFLLLFVSGIPLLEQKMDQSYGSNKAYQEYKKRVPLLIPKFS